MKSPLVVLSVTALMVLPMTAAFAEKSYTVADAKGRYVFSFQGETAGDAAVAVAATGYMVADGKGKAEEGLRTINLGGTSYQQHFSCDLEVYADGTGKAVCPLTDFDPDWPLGDTPETFDFVLNKNGTEFSFVGTTAGITVLGSGAR